jgi:Flp pilus assembly pilin Flp
MNTFTHLEIAYTYWRAHLDRARRDERGASAPEYLVLLLGVLAIAAIAIVGVKTFVQGKSDELNGGQP